MRVRRLDRSQGWLSLAIFAHERSKHAPDGRQPGAERSRGGVTRLAGPAAAGWAAWAAAGLAPSRSGEQRPSVAQRTQRHLTLPGSSDHLWLLCVAAMVMYREGSTRRRKALADGRARPDRVVVQASDGGQPAGDGGAGTSGGFEVTGEQLDVRRGGWRTAAAAAAGTRR
jgi:hypothetical protein